MSVRLRKATLQIRVAHYVGDSQLVPDDSSMKVALVLVEIRRTPLPDQEFVSVVVLTFRREGFRTRRSLLLINQSE